MEAASPLSLQEFFAAGEFSASAFTTNQIAMLTTLGMTNMTMEELNVKKKKKQKTPQANPGVLILQAEEANVPIGLGLGCWSSIASCFAINQVASVRLQ